MDFLILILVLGVAGHQIYLHLFLRKELRALRISNRTQQGRMRKLSRSTPDQPLVLDKARTIKRDSDDLPATGRMGKLIPLKGGNNDASIRDDD